MSLKKATADNVSLFLAHGTSLMWPRNWEKYPNPAGKIALQMSNVRDKGLLSFKEGVYFTGCGHLKDILRLSHGNLKMIGGEHILS